MTPVFRNVLADDTAVFSHSVELYQRGQSVSLNNNTVKGLRCVNQTENSSPASRSCLCAMEFSENETFASKVNHYQKYDLY